LAGSYGGGDGGRRQREGLSAPHNEAESSVGEKGAAHLLPPFDEAESVVWLEVREETTEGGIGEKGSAHLLDKAESTIGEKGAAHLLPSFDEVESVV
jgi:hypothetical protein